MIPNNEVLGAGDGDLDFDERSFSLVSMGSEDRQRHEEPDLLLQKALQSVLHCKKLTQQVTRYLFANSSENPAAENSRAALLETGDELEATEAHLRAALIEEDYQHERLSAVTAAKVAAETHLAEARAEADWLQSELNSASEQLLSARDRIYLQVRHSLTPIRFAISHLPVFCCNQANSPILYVL